RGSVTTVSGLDRGLEPLEVRIFEFRAAELFAVAFVKPIEPHGVEDLPEWLPITKDSNERPFGSRAVHPERDRHTMLLAGPIRNSENCPASSASAHVANPNVTGLPCPRAGGEIAGSRSRGFGATTRPPPRARADHAAARAPRDRGACRVRGPSL